MAVFWDVAPWGLVNIDQRSGGVYCLHHQEVIIIMIEAVSSYEMLVRIYQTARYISHLHVHCHENLPNIQW
jgi:hypothetical protein